MLVSVILPTYNTKPEMLLESVNSILKQSFKNLELIIVDDGSNRIDNYDYLLSVICDSRVKIYKNHENSGVAFSLNRAIDLTNGELIFRMDSDDIAKKNRIKYTVNYLEKHPEINVVGSFASSFGAIKKKMIYPVSNQEIRAELFFNNPFCHPSVCFRKQVLKDYGFRYTRDVPNEDYDLWIRLSYNPKVVFCNIPKVLLKYRFHEGQVTNVDYAKLKKNTSKIIKGLYESYDIAFLTNVELDSYVNALYNNEVSDNDVRSFNRIACLFKDSNFINNPFLENKISSKYCRIFIKQVLLKKNFCNSFDLSIINTNSLSLVERITFRIAKVIYLRNIHDKKN